VSKNQTPLQEVIAFCGSVTKEENEQLYYLKVFATLLLPAEREAIEKSYDAGFDNGCDEPANYKGHGYFDQTYEQ
jgi:hypothetical protein